MFDFHTSHLFRDDSCLSPVFALCKKLISKNGANSYLTYKVCYMIAQAEKPAAINRFQLPVVSTVSVIVAE